MKFRQRKGQAFETMMLVISVIVALAILGVLLNILGGVGGLFNPSNPVDSIKKELIRVGGQYSPGEAPVEVKLVKDQTIDTRQVTQDNANVLAEEVTFVIDETLEGEVEPTGATPRFTIKKDVQAVVVVCGDPSGSSEVKYAVAIARPSQGNEAADQCRSAVGIA